MSFSASFVSVAAITFVARNKAINDKQGEQTAEKRRGYQGSDLGASWLAEVAGRVKADGHSGLGYIVIFHVVWQQVLVCEWAGFVGATGMEGATVGQPRSCDPDSERAIPVLFGPKYAGWRGGAVGLLGC